MRRKSTTEELIESRQGQHMALAVAAQLARSQLVSNAQAVYDSRHLSDMLDIVGNALIRVCTVYVRDGVGEPRELPPAELQGASVTRSASMLSVRDGRAFSSVSIKRADLRRGIAVLQAIGIAGISRPAQSATPPSRERPVEWQGVLAELERLLQPPLLAAQMERASQLLISVARNAPDGRIANTAMQLMSACHELKDAEGADERRVQVLLAHLRSSLDESAQS